MLIVVTLNGKGSSVEIYFRPPIWIGSRHAWKSRWNHCPFDACLKLFYQKIKMKRGTVASSLSGPLVFTHSYSGVTNENRGAILMNPHPSEIKKKRGKRHKGEGPGREAGEADFYVYISCPSILFFSFNPQLLLKVSLFQSGLFLYRLCPFYCPGVQPRVLHSWLQSQVTQ